MTVQIFPDWKSKVVFSTEGPQPQALWVEDQFKVVLAGLEPGQKIPIHPEGSSVYHILEGNGTMFVDGQAIDVQPGMILTMPNGAARGLEARTRLVFLAARAVLTTSPG